MCGCEQTLCIPQRKVPLSELPFNNLNGEALRLRSMNDLKGSQIQATHGTVGHVKDFYFDDEWWTVRYLVGPYTDPYWTESLSARPELTF